MENTITKPKTKPKVIEAEPKPGPVIDTAALQKLLDAKPPEPVLVEVRCDHYRHVWVVLEKGRVVQTLSSGVLVNVELCSEETGSGCGGSIYTGTAKGLCYNTSGPISAPEELLRRMVFDRRDGSFLDARTYETLTHVDYLILEEHCGHRYINGPL